MAAHRPSRPGAGRSTREPIMMAMQPGPTDGSVDHGSATGHHHAPEIEVGAWRGETRRRPRHCPAWLSAHPSSLGTTADSDITLFDSILEKAEELLHKRPRHGTDTERMQSSTGTSIFNVRIDAAAVPTTSKSRRRVFSPIATGSNHECNPSAWPFCVSPTSAVCCTTRPS